jgi:hypothetical protein
MAAFTVVSVKPKVEEQIENGEQLLQSFFGFEWDVCAVCVSSSQLSKREQGTTALNKM